MHHSMPSPLARPLSYFALSLFGLGCASTPDSSVDRSASGGSAGSLNGSGGANVAGQNFGTSGSAGSTVGGGGTSGGASMGGASVGGASVGGNSNTSGGANSGGANSSGAGGTAGAGGTGPAGTPIPCDAPFSVQSLDGCLTTVEGLQVKFFPIAAGQKVSNLAVYLHSDLAGEWYNNSAFPTIVNWARPKGFLVLAILSPVAGSDGKPRYGIAQAPDADKVAKTIEAFMVAYGPSRQKTFYWGVSGGAWFMTSSFIAHVGEHYPGIFAVNCGGSGRSWGWSWDPSQDTTTRGEIALLMNYGTNDFLATDEAGSVKDFQNRGFAVEQIVQQGASHCNHPIDQPTIDFWTKHL